MASLEYASPNNAKVVIQVKLTAICVKLLVDSPADNLAGDPVDASLVDDLLYDYLVEKIVVYFSVEDNAVCKPPWTTRPTAWQVPCEGECPLPSGQPSG